MPATNMILLGTEQLNIGRNLVTAATFDGLIDDVLYFDRALSQADLVAIYGADIFADGFEE